MNNDINNEEQNVSGLQHTEEPEHPKILTVHTVKKKAIPVHIQEIGTSEKNSEISTVSLDKKETYRSIVELPAYSSFLMLDFLNIATFLIILMGVITGFAYQLKQAYPDSYFMPFVLIVFDVIFLYYLFKANKERLKSQALNELSLNFSKKNSDFKITNREYLTFLLEHSNNYLIVKEAIFEEINKLSTKGYSLEKFLKQNLHTTLKTNFSKMEEECIKKVKDNLFDETYKGT